MITSIATIVISCSPLHESALLLIYDSVHPWHWSPRSSIIYSTLEISYFIWYRYKCENRKVFYVALFRNTTTQTDLWPMNFASHRRCLTDYQCLNNQIFAPTTRLNNNQFRSQSPFPFCFARLANDVHLCSFCNWRFLHKHILGMITCLLARIDDIKWFVQIIYNRPCKMSSKYCHSINICNDWQLLQKPLSKSGYFQCSHRDYICILYQSLCSYHINIYVTTTGRVRVLK